MYHADLHIVFIALETGNGIMQVFMRLLVRVFLQPSKSFERHGIAVQCYNSPVISAHSSAG